MRTIGQLIDAITQAIIRQEGMPADYTNPGNLRAAPWLPIAAIVTARGFWVPETRAQGVAGAAHVVALHIAEGNTLTQLISMWAPASDHHNDTATYIQHVSEWAQIPDVNVPLWTLVQG